MHITTAPALSGREQSRLYASDAAFEALRARTYARAHPGCPVPQTEAAWAAAEADAQCAMEAMRPQSERRQRALEAQRTGRRTPRPRQHRLPPEPSRQYCPACPTTVDRDQRLTPGARACLHIIRAVIGRDATKVITKTYLAQRMGCHPRTIQRYLAEARAAGYITTLPVFAPNGRQIGQRISITEALRPFWETGETSPSSLKGFPLNGESKERQNPAAFSKEFACKGLSAMPERRPPSG